jgi:hypothetical protein
MVNIATIMYADDLVLMSCGRAKLELEQCFRCSIVCAAERLERQCS